MKLINWSNSSEELIPLSHLAQDSGPLSCVQWNDKSDVSCLLFSYCTAEETDKKHSFLKQKMRFCYLLLIANKKDYCLQNSSKLKLD